MIGSGGGFRLVQGTGIERHCASQEFHGKNSLLFFWQGFESLQELGRLPAHDLRVPVSAFIDEELLADTVTCREGNFAVDKSSRPRTAGTRLLHSPARYEGVFQPGLASLSSVI